MFQSLGGRAAVVDVSARDGLQMAPVTLPPQTRAEWIRALLEAGVPEVEAGSFVDFRRVPQMTGAAELLAHLAPFSGRLWFVVANPRGLREAVAAGVRNVVCVLSATEAHSRENLGRPVDGVLADTAPMARDALREGLRIRASLSMAWVDPAEGPVPATRVAALCRALREMGFPEVTVCDTYGAASPRAVAELVDAVSGEFPAHRVGVHLHDSFGAASANALAALLAGVRRFDASIGGLGGCPFVPGAGGNLSTESLVRLLHGLGLETGIDADALDRTSRACLALLERETGAVSPTAARQTESKEGSWPRPHSA